MLMSSAYGSHQIGSEYVIDISMIFVDLKMAATENIDTMQEGRAFENQYCKYCRE